MPEIHPGIPERAASVITRPFLRSTLSLPACASSEYANEARELGGSSVRLGRSSITRLMETSLRRNPPAFQVSLHGYKKMTEINRTLTNEADSVITDRLK